MVRVFIALDLPREVINELKKVQDIIKKKTLVTGKFTEPENFHLTMKFLGEIEESKIKKIHERLKKIKFNSFDVKLSELGVFSPKLIKIIWVKLNGKGIFELQKHIDEKLKESFKKENRFMSHITIARIKYVSDKKSFLKYLSTIKIKNINFKVKCFYLMKSDLKPNGPEYTELEKYNFV